MVVVSDVVFVWPTFYFGEQNVWKKNVTSIEILFIMPLYTYTNRKSILWLQLLINQVKFNDLQYYCNSITKNAVEHNHLKS